MGTFLYLYLCPHEKWMAVLPPPSLYSGLSQVTLYARPLWCWAWPCHLLWPMRSQQIRLTHRLEKCCTSLLLLLLVCNFHENISTLVCWKRAQPRCPVVRAKAILDKPITSWLPDMCRNPEIRTTVQPGKVTSTTQVIKRHCCVIDKWQNYMLQFKVKTYI